MTETLKKPWYQQPLVWMLIGIPLSAVVMGIATIYLAIVSNDGLVVDDYYQKGKEINLDLARDTAASQYQLNGILDIDSQNQTLRFSLNKGNLPSLPTELRAGLYHATRQGFDKNLVLSLTPEGSYYTALPDMPPGRWHVEI